MEYWIAGYLLGMLATAGVMGWVSDGNMNYTSGQLAVGGALVVAWPLWWAVAVGLVFYCFGLALFNRKYERKLI